eukprot:COSAG01_NODE_7310_length_3257_cov_3.826156_4_plen_115_part_00
MPMHIRTFTLGNVIMCTVSVSPSCLPPCSNSYSFGMVACTTVMVVGASGRRHPTLSSLVAPHTQPLPSSSKALRTRSCCCQVAALVWVYTNRCIRKQAGVKSGILMISLASTTS